jgi:hypothetical protein
MSFKTQRGWGHWRKANVDESELRNVTNTVKPCIFSEVLKRAKQALATGDGTHTRIPGWISEDFNFDHKNVEEP